MIIKCYFFILSIILFAFSKISTFLNINTQTHKRITKLIYIENINQ